MWREEEPPLQLPVGCKARPPTAATVVRQPRRPLPAFWGSPVHNAALAAPRFGFLPTTVSRSKPEQASPTLPPTQLPPPSPHTQIPSEGASAPSDLGCLQLGSQKKAPPLCRGPPASALPVSRRSITQLGTLQLMLTPAPPWGGMVKSVPPPILYPHNKGGNPSGDSDEAS